MLKEFLWLENMPMILDISAEGGLLLGKEPVAELLLVSTLWHYTRHNMTSKNIATFNWNKGNITHDFD